MKILSVLFLAILAVSCVSTKYHYVNNRNFADIQAGTKYTVYDKRDRKIFLNVTSVAKDSIIGTRKNQPFVIAKNDIKEIKKNRNGATIALVGGSVVVIGGTALIVSAFKTGAEAFGNAIGGIR